MAFITVPCLGEAESLPSPGRPLLYSDTRSLLRAVAVTPDKLLLKLIATHLRVSRAVGRTCSPTNRLVIFTGNKCLLGQ